MPPSRRIGRPPSRRTTAEPPAEASVDEFPAQDAGVEVEEPAGEAAARAEAAPESTGRSGRRGGGGSRRSASVSASSPARSSRKVATPEQRAASRRAMVQAIKLLLLVIILGGVGFGVWYFGMRTDERTIKAQDHLLQVRSGIKTIEVSISNREPEKARAAYDEALKVLEASAELGYAAEPLNPENPRLVERKAREAVELKKELLETHKKRIERSERDAKAEGNRRKLLAAFGALNTIDDAALVNLEKDAAKFMDNPVEPEAGRHEDHVKDYSSEISDIKVKMIRIAQESDRRKSEITDVPVRQAHLEAENLIKQERFKEALVKIDEMQRTYADADFENVRGFVRDAAKQAWDSASSYAENNYKTFSSPGTSENNRPAALKNAQTRMQQVIERFGLEEYVTKAQEALTRYVPK